MALTPAGGVPISDTFGNEDYLLAEVGGNTRRVTPLSIGKGYASVAELIADTRTFTAGTTLTIPSLGFAYAVADAAATDFHLIMAGGSKIYALPNADGEITSTQLGWTTGYDITTDIIRFWPRFNAGEGLVFDHLVNCGNISLTMPENFTLRASELKVGGINFTVAAFATVNAPAFKPSNGGTVKGMRFVTDIVVLKSARVLENTAGTTTEDSLVDFTVQDCYFDVPLNAPLRLWNTVGLLVEGNEFRDGQYFINMYASKQARIVRNRFISDTAIYSNHEHLKLQQNEFGGHFGLYVGENEFIRSERDGIDATGAMIDALIERNRFIACGGGVDGVTGVGFGGIDIKSDQQERASPEFRNFNITVRDNYFEDSQVACVSLWGHEGGSWTDPTPDETLQYTTSEIFLKNNLFVKTGNNNLRTTFLTGLGGNFYLDGDTFLGGAFPSCGAPQSLTAKNLYLEMVGGNSKDFMAFTNCKNLDLHFRLIQTRLPLVAGNNWMPISDSSNIRISGNVDIRHEGMAAVFLVNDVCEDISISLKGSYTGGGTFIPRGVYIDSHNTGDVFDNITIHDCDLVGFDNLLGLKTSGAGNPATNVSVLNNRFSGPGALLDFLTFSNASDVNGLKVLGNQGYGTSALWEGTSTAVVWSDIADNRAFTGSAAIPVAKLPAGYQGQRMWVNDATASTFYSIVAGGGALTVNVNFDGTNWRVA